MNKWIRYGCMHSWDLYIAMPYQYHSFCGLPQAVEWIKRPLQFWSLIVQSGDPKHNRPSIGFDRSSLITITLRLVAITLKIVAITFRLVAIMFRVVPITFRVVAIIRIRRPRQMSWISGLRRRCYRLVACLWVEVRA